MKASELIEVLKRRIERHGDLEVIVTWEGQTFEIEHRFVYGSKGTKESPPEIVIHADYGAGKEWDAVDPNEGEDGR